MSDGGIRSNPWVQLVAGIICMAMVANLQYGWTVFVDPINAKYHWGRVAIQNTFTLFVLMETWLVPFEAYLADRFGPRILVACGAFLIALAWIIMSGAHSLRMLYAGGMVGGAGTGLVYGTCVGNAVKWFASRRGLGAGLTAAGFGAGSAVTIWPLTHSLAAHGYEATFFRFALIQGSIVLAASFFLAHPPKIVAAPRAAVSGTDSTPLQMAGKPIFWLMYIAFVLAGSSGLMATAQLAPIATSFGIAKQSVTLLGFTYPALVFALSLNNLMNGLGRPLFGHASDRFGREYTLFASFIGGAVAMLALSRFGRDPMLFVLCTAAIYIFWGDIYSIFPALTSDEFGTKYATTNYGMLYTGKGWASFLAPIAGLIAVRTGNWSASLEIAAAANVLAALLLIFGVRPLRRHLRRLGHRCS